MSHRLRELFGSTANLLFMKRIIITIETVISIITIDIVDSPQYLKFEASLAIENAFYLNICIVYTVKPPKGNHNCGDFSRKTVERCDCFGSVMTLYYPGSITDCIGIWRYTDLLLRTEQYLCSLGLRNGVPHTQFFAIWRSVNRLW